MIIDRQRVYAIDADRWTKVGISTSPVRRLKEIQTNCPFPVTLSAVYASDNARVFETKLHDRFDEYRADRGGGSEWFELPDDIHAALAGSSFQRVGSKDDPVPAPRWPLIGVEQADALPSPRDESEGPCGDCGRSYTAGIAALHDDADQETRTAALSLCVSCTIERWPAGLDIDLPLAASDVKISKRENKIVLK